MQFFDCHTHSISANAYLSILQKEALVLQRWHSVGLHPWDTEEYVLSEAKSLVVNSINEFTVAIGECGIDGLRGVSMEMQYKLFLEQAQLAEEIKLPVIIHCVKGWEWILKAYKVVQPKQKWIFHGFTKRNLLPQVLACPQIQVSIGASILKENADNSWIREIPDDRLLLETDTADVDIKTIYEIVSITKGISLRVLLEHIHTNFKQTFTKWHNG